MTSSEGFSELLWMGREGDYNVMVSKLLGPSLADLHEYCHSKFNLKTVLLIFDQSVRPSYNLQLQRVEQLHKNDVIHRDIKPENFTIGTDESPETIHVIDFGLSK